VYVDNLNAGTAKVSAVGKNGCYGKSEPLEFAINKKNFKSVKIAKLGTMVYRSHLENLNPKVSSGKTVLEKDVDYTITAEEYGESSFGTKKKIKVKLTFAPLESSVNFAAGTTKTVTVTLVKRSLASKLTTKVVDEEGVVAVYYNGVKLTENTDYTVSEKRNGDRTITGIGIYTGKRLLKK